VLEQIQRFLAELDRALSEEAADGERLDLYQLGRSALILHYGLPMPTRDFDIVWMRTPLEQRAIGLFGKNSANARQLGLYLEVVPAGVPPVPQWFRSRCTEVSGARRVIRLWRPEPHDLAATKLKSFRPQDRVDLQFLCDEGLRRSLESAFAFVHEKDDDPNRDRAFANLERVIRYLQGEIPSL
jgi:hypothetical protein